MAKERKTTKGKQKIEIKMIEDEDARYISFSKRRNGVYAKASDLSTLCGAELAVLIFSPTGRPHSFGSPAVVPIMDRFLPGIPLERPVTPAEQAYRRQVMQELSRKVMDAGNDLEACKAKKAALEMRRAAARAGMEWMDDLDRMGLQQMDQMVEMLEDLKFRVDEQVRMHLAGAANYNAGAPWYGGGGGGGGGGGINLITVNGEGGGGGYFQSLPPWNHQFMGAMSSPKVGMEENFYEHAGLQEAAPHNGGGVDEFTDVNGFIDGI